MSCSLKQVKRDSYNHIKNKIIKDVDSVTWRDGNTVVFSSGTKGVKSEKNALRHAQRKQKAIEKWAGETFGPGFATGWATINVGGNEIVMDLRFPNRLSQAWQAKLEREQAKEGAAIEEEYKQTIEDRMEEMEQTMRDYGNQFFYNGEVYPTKEDMHAAMRENQEEQFLFDTSPVDHSDKLRLPYYIGAKKLLLERVNSFIQSIEAQRNSFRGDNVTSELLSKQITELREIKTKIETQLDYMEQGSDTVMDKVYESIKEDFHFVDELLTFSSNDSLEYKLAHLDLAKDIMEFFRRVKNSTENSKNGLVGEKGIVKNLPPELQQFFNKVAAETSTRESKITTLEHGILTEIVSADPSIRKLYPNSEGQEMSVEEIVLEIMDSKEDIDIFSEYLLSINKSLNKDDGLFGQLIIRHLRNKINDKKYKVIGFKQRLDSIHKDVVNELLKLNQNFAGKIMGHFTSEVSFDIFFRKNAFGRAGQIIDVFSGKWDKKLEELGILTKQYRNAMLKKDGDLIRDAVKKRQNWLLSNTNMIDITKLPEVIDNPRFRKWKNLYGDSAQAEAYKQELIAKIGKHNYNKLVNKQQKLLDDFIQSVDKKYKEAFQLYKVNDITELPEHEQYRLIAFELGRDPFRLLESLKGDVANYAKIPYDIGDNNSTQFESHILYNAYYPKENVTKIDQKTGDLKEEDSGYYDQDFKTISDNSTLLEFWEILREANEFMLQTLSQSGTFLSEGSLIFHQKNIAEIMLSKEANIFRDGKKFIFTAARNAIADILGVKKSDSVYQADKVNRGRIQTIEEKANAIVNNEVMVLENIAGIKITPSTMMVLDKVSPEIQQYFINLLKVNNIDEVIAITGKGIRPKSVMKGAVTERIMGEQTMNLPLLMKAYLDIVAEYGGRQDALPLVRVFKDMHMRIDRKKKLGDIDATNDTELEARNDVATGRRDGVGGDRRVRSDKRIKDGYEKHVLNRSQKETWGEFGKIYDSYEKDIIKEISKQEKSIQERIANLEQESLREMDPHKIQAIEDKIAGYNDTLERLNNQKKHMGYTMAFSALYESMISKLARYRALGWAVMAPIKNQIEGMRNAIIFDTGNYATPGNITAASAFYYRGAMTRYISPKMADEKRKTNLFIQNMDLIQNGANEFEKNSRKTGPQAKMSWFKAYKGTEVAETNVQTPEILAMLMDERVEYYDENGQRHVVAVFNGDGFPAHDIIDGKLILKPEFRRNADGSLNEDQINTWENFTGNNYNLLKTRIDNNIAEINGAYDEFGSMMAKNNVIAGSLMTFKTWFPNFIWTRFAKNQRVLETGKASYTGYYRQTVFSKNPRANFAGLTGAGINMFLQAMNRGHVGFVATGLSAVGLSIGFNALALAMPIGMLGVGAATLYQLRKNDIEHVNGLRQSAAMLRGIMTKFMGLPLNFLASFATKKSKKNETKSQLIKDYDYKMLGVTPEEVVALNSLSSEIAINLSTFVFKTGLAYLASLLLHDDEEDEKLYKTTYANERAFNKAIMEQDQNDPRLQMAFTGTSNLLNELLETGVMVTDPIQMLDVAGRRNALYSRADDLFKTTTMVGAWMQGKDYTLSGYNEGESKVGNAVLKGLGAPKFLTDKYLGVENMLVRDFTPEAGPETWFNTDMKDDLSEIKRIRKEQSSRLRKEYREKFDYENADRLGKEMLDRKIQFFINQILQEEYPIPKRDDYTDDQNRK